MKIGIGSVIDLVLLVASGIYTILLIGFKKEMKPTINAHYNSSWDRAMAIAHFPNYWNYLAWGAGFLLILILFGGVCIVSGWFELEVYEKIIIAILNLLAIYILWQVFYDPIFTTFLLITLGFTGGSYVGAKVIAT